MIRVDIVCPSCRMSGVVSVLGDLAEICKSGTGELKCECGNAYPVIDGIPILVPEERRQEITMPGGELPLHEEFRSLPTERVARLVKRQSAGLSLDAGCGKGPYNSYFNGDIVLADINYYFVKEALARYQGNNHACGVVMDASRIAFPPDAFDFILCSNIIEHLPPEDLKRILDSFKETTRGVFQLDVPNEAGLIKVLRKALHSLGIFETSESEDPAYLHQSFFSAGRLSHAGFKVRGCIGWVTRDTFGPKVLWDVYDAAVYHLPILAGTLIGIYDKKAQT